MAGGHGSSALARGGLRYLMAKLNTAADICLNELSAAGGSKAASSSSSVVSLFSDAFRKQLTTVIAVTGAAMAPAINPDALQEPSSFEKLVVRLIPRPSPRNVAVGDVVAFNSPLSPADTHSLLVRRVAALEGHSMMSDEEAGFSERVPPGHCWVLADNEALGPPDVIDSRAFGYLDMRLIMGRVIYQVRGKQQHGPVANSPSSEAEDMAVVDSEVDVDALSEGMAGSSGGSEQQEQQE